MNDLPTGHPIATRAKATSTKATPTKVKAAKIKAAEVTPPKAKAIKAKAAKEPAEKTKTVKTKKAAIAAPKTAPARRRAAAPKPPKSVLASERLKDAIVRSLDDDKGEDMVTVDLRGRSAIADFIVIATGRSTRQVAAMAGHLIDRLQADLSFRMSVEGLAQADWVLVDCGDVIVHLFRPEVRTFYAIEKMWGLEPPAAATA